MSINIIKEAVNQVFAGEKKRPAECRRRGDQVLSASLIFNHQRMR